MAGSSSARQGVAALTLWVYSLLNAALRNKHRLTHFDGESGSFAFDYDNKTISIQIKVSEKENADAEKRTAP